MNRRHTLDNGVERPLAEGRRTLWLGFGSILLLMTLTGFDISTSLRAANRRNADLMKSFRPRDQILDQLSSLVARSAAPFGIICPKRMRKRPMRCVRSWRQRAGAASLCSISTIASLAGRPQNSRPQDRRKPSVIYAATWKLIGNRWRRRCNWITLPEGEKGEDYRLRAAASFRADVLRVSRQITQLDEDQLEAGERQIQQEQDRVRSRLLLESALGVCTGILLAVFVATRITRLEHAAELHHRKVDQARSEMRELAEKLQSTQEDECKRLSRELHDQVGQSMYAVLVELGNIEAGLPTEQPIRFRLASFRRQLESVVQSVRDMALLLRPSMLDDLGLVAAVKWQGREVARRTGLRIRVDAEDSSDHLPESYRTCVYRIVQEALNNCARHAAAASVRVSLTQNESSLEVSVRDDGKGFDNVREKGLGLLGMEERVARLGGVIKVESRRGEGTLLSARIPLPVLTHPLQVS
jgi:signal transduction histidine kinase